MENFIKKIEEIAQRDYQGIINSDDCYVKNAIDAFQRYINYKIENQDIGYLINNLDQESSIKDDINENIADDEQEKFNLNFSKRFEKICKTENQKEFVNRLYNLIAQVDMNAANKSQYNQNGIVAIGKTGIRQNMWVENLLKYKRDNNCSNINSNNIKNCIAYLNNPESKYPILQEDHYIKIEKYIPKLFLTDWNICKNKMNNTYLIKEILYRDMEIRDLWNKKELKNLTPYEVACVAMYILFKQENKILCKSDDLKNCQFTKEVLKIQEKRNFQFPSVIKKRVDTLKNPNIIIENNEYKLTNEGLNNSEKLYKELNLNYVINNEKEDTIMEQPLNQILYGPPGTGKTYNTVVKAMEIIGSNYVNLKDEKGNFKIDYSSDEYEKLKEEFDNYKNEGRIEFVTFHQSYSYEEFVEGIKPYIPEWGSTDNTEVKYIGENGIFKRICKKAENPIIESNNSNLELNDNPKIWKVSLMKTGENDIRKDCMENNRIRIGFDKYGETINDETIFDDGGSRVLSAFIYKMEIGDIVLSCYSEKTIDAIGVVTSEYKWNDDFNQYKRYREVKWLAKGLNHNILEINNGTKFTLGTVYQLNNMSLKDVLDILDKQEQITGYKENDKPHILIIDEINRGDVSKIFGELITLIEEDKRIGNKHQMKITLPYSKESFGVPNNLYIIGTMNTADRSIALLDTALRRRFDFEEIMPRPELLNNKTVEGINLQALLTAINKRITDKYNRDHQIGHSYLIGVNTKEQLKRAYKNRILPLLNEYFYNESKTVAEILNCSEEELKTCDFVYILGKSQGE